MIYGKLGIILFIIVITAAIIGMKNKRANEFFYPREEKVIAPIAVPQEGGKEIMVTNGVKHSIPLEEIQSGGVGKDGIPAIDHPQFASISETEQWLADDEPGVTFSRGGTHRFYPYYILLFHEIVNDIVPAEYGYLKNCRTAPRSASILFPRFGSAGLPRIQTQIFINKKENFELCNTLSAHTFKSIL